MHGLSSSLTAGILLAHALLGCCWHHAHACGHAHSAVAWIVAGCEAEGPHEHSGDAPDRPGQGPGRDACRGAKCDFVRPATENLLPLAAAPCRPASAAIVASERSALIGDAAQHPCAAGDLLLPVRLHLVHQVLLI